MKISKQILQKETENQNYLYCNLLKIVKYCIYCIVRLALIEHCFHPFS